MFNNDRMARTATWISLGLMLIIMLFVSRDFGITGDEVTQNTYGERVYAYYSTLGRDQSYMEPFGRINNAFYYGGFYDLLCVTVNKFLSFDIYETRHFINAIFGFFILFFAARLAAYLKGWDAAFLAIWFLFLSPRFFGESMNNPKDVPFALGMLMGVYFICRFLNAYPRPGWKNTVGVMASIALAINIRVGGILLIPFLGVGVLIQYFAVWRKKYPLSDKMYKDLVLRCAGISLGGYLLGLVFWPYGLSSPFSNPFKALGEMSQFSTSIGMIFDGRKILSDNVPWFYIPKWIFISTPIIVLLGFVLSPLLLVRRAFKFSQVCFVFFAAVFPVAYIIYKHSPLYDGWRHLFFVFPPLAVLSALAFVFIAGRLPGKPARYALVAVLVLGLFLPARWAVANHPNQTVYFNELAGGIDGAYGYYETDYYMNSVKQAAYRLAREKNLFTTRDSVVVATNALEPVLHYMKMINPRLKVLYIRYYQRNEQPWDYALIYTRFLDKSLLQNGYFPPANTIDVVKADQTPLCAIVAGEPGQLAYKANEAMKKNNFDSAIHYFRLHLQKDPKDESSYDNYAIALANRGQLPQAIEVLKTKLKIVPEDLQTLELLARLYQAAGDMQQAQQVNMTMQGIIQEQQGEAAN